MKKISFSALLASAILCATEYNYEISPMLGYALPGEQNLKDHSVYGVELLYNRLGTAIKPELSVLYSDADYKNGGGDTNIFRTALNGVYELSPINNFTPFVKAGAGYEYMGSARFDNHNSPFLNVGVGTKMGLTEQLALKLEAIEMVKYNDQEWDHNVIFLAGLCYAFGPKAQPVAPVIEVKKEEPKAEPKPAPVAVVAPAPVKPAPVDSDKDGVFDDSDKCPNTPSGFKVDGDGCPLSATLRLNFVFDTNKITDPDSTAKVTNFANFMKESPAYKANITGHTDSVGKDAYNQKLSEKRAEIVKKMLVDQGVESDRLSTSGKGETQPVATNKTKEGRAENRRIEVELTH